MREQRRKKTHANTGEWKKQAYLLIVFSSNPSIQPIIHPYTQPAAIIELLHLSIGALARYVCTVCMNNSRLFFIWNAQLTTKILSHLNARLFTCQVIFSGIFFLLSPFLSFVCACFFRALVIWTFKNKINFVIVNFSLLCSSSKMLLFFLLFAHSLTHSSVRCVFLSSS